MSAFWSWWVMGLIVFNLGISFFLFLWAPRVKIPTVADGTTGHVWAHGVLREGLHPLPRWWLLFSLAMFIAGVGHLVLYPGFGNSTGRLGWTSHGELAGDTAANRERMQPVMQRVMALPPEKLARDGQAMALGKVLFADNCAACHGSQGQGNQMLGAPNLSDGDWLYGGDGKTILTSIQDGRHGVMQPWGQALGESGVDELTTYVLSLSRGVPHNAEDTLKAEAGRKRFSACAACHGMKGKGNPALGAPDLTDSIWLYGGTRQAVAQTIRDGRSGVMPAWRGRLSDTDVRVLAAYVQSLSHQSRAQP